MAYWDDGNFGVMFINHEGKETKLLDVNDACGISKDSKVIEGFWEPLVTVTFLNKDEAYVSAYHRM